MTKREVMQMALDALEAHLDIGIRSDRAIAALREELAKPEPEPVAWMTDPVKDVAHYAMERDVDFNKPISKSDWVITPLYRKEDL